MWQVSLYGLWGKPSIPLIDVVPLGLYAVQALQNLGLLEYLKPYMVYYDNARCSLIPVLRDEVELGIIYVSDLTSNPDLHISHTHFSMHEFLVGSQTVISCQVTVIFLSKMVPLNSKPRHLLSDEVPLR